VSRKKNCASSSNYEKASLDLLSLFSKVEVGGVERAGSRANIEVIRPIVSDMPSPGPLFSQFLMPVVNILVQKKVLSGSGRATRRPCISPSP